jgi:hypothetical protein
MWTCKLCNQDKELISSFHGVCMDCVERAKVIAGTQGVSTKVVIERMMRAQERAEEQVADGAPPQKAEPKEETRYIVDVDDLPKLKRKAGKPLKVTRRDTVDYTDEGDRLIITHEMDSEKYRKLEYQTNDNQYVALITDLPDTLRYHENLMDCALAGRDFEWAEYLHGKLKKIKGAINRAEQ